MGFDVLGVLIRCGIGFGFLDCCTSMGFGMEIGGVVLYIPAF